MKQLPTSIPKLGFLVPIAVMIPAKIDIANPIDKKIEAHFSKLIPLSRWRPLHPKSRAKAG